MNMVSPEGSVNWLFIDLNSYFASCEQQARPELRGKPVAIVQMMTDSTCAIAASREAKKFGVKTGTMIWKAKKLCPHIALVKARHKMYVEYHHRIVEAVESCLHVDKVMSIDEMACRLMGPERYVPNAQELARKVKRTIRERMGEVMTSSIGLAPSLFLGKVGSDMQKPDGLVTITRKDLPDILHPLELQDIYGIGARMEYRLHQAGICSVADLMRASRPQLRRVWGGINGVLYYELLHGADLQFPSSPLSHSISHQHVLEPQLRTYDGAREFSQHLMAKAAERLRHKDYYAQRLGLFISWDHHRGQYWDEVGFAETQNTDFLLTRLMQLWPRVPHLRPKKIGVVLMGLVPAAQHQGDLFIEGQHQHRLSPLIDKLNRRYGRGAVTFGLPDPAIRAFTGHAAFQRVPEVFEFS